MSDQHKPLTAAEIEELKALEAQASKGTWVVEKPFSHPGVQAVKTDGSFDWICHAQVSNMPGWLKDSVFIAAMRNAIPRLLSMLTPPTDAEVREAVERLGNPAITQGEGFRMALVHRDYIDIILRAVQAPRLTVEHENVVRAAKQFCRAKTARDRHNGEQHLANMLAALEARN